MRTLGTRTFTQLPQQAAKQAIPRSRLLAGTRQSIVVPRLIWNILWLGVVLNVSYRVLPVVYDLTIGDDSEEHTLH